MNTRLVLITIILPVLFLSSCISRECKSVRDKDLVLSIEYLNVSDTMSIGDTISIRSLFSNALIDPGYPDDVKMLEDWYFFTLIIFTRYVDGEIQPMEINSDQILNENVEYELIQFSSDAGLGTGIIIDKHNYMEEEYDFSFNLILEKTGIYNIANISNLGLTINTSRQTYPDKCPNEDISAVYYVNNGDLDKNNYDLYANIPGNENASERNFIRDGIITFYVKE